jgi:hypothetical protein
MNIPGETYVYQNFAFFIFTDQNDSRALPDAACLPHRKKKY